MDDRSSLFREQRLVRFHARHVARFILRPLRMAPIAGIWDDRLWILLVQGQAFAGLDDLEIMGVDVSGDRRSCGFDHMAG